MLLNRSRKNLERDGYVVRTVTPTVPPRVDYALTDLSTGVCEPITVLGRWAIANHARIKAARRRSDDAISISDA